MNNLLNANLSRLWGNKVFWGSASFMAFMGALMPIIRYKDMLNFKTIYNLDDRFFTCVLLISFVSSVLCSLFVGTEYSDGTMRNKIIAGRSRQSIYFSNLFTVATASFILCTFFYVIYFCVGYPLLGTFNNDIFSILTLIVCAYLLTLAFCSIFTLIAMLIQNKAVVAIICIFLTIILLIIGSMLFVGLNEPEIIPAHTSTNGSPIYDVDTPNPRYLVGIERNIYSFLYDILPGGQIVQFMSMQISNPVILALYSCTITIVTTAIGIFFFRRKDIK